VFTIVRLMHNAPYQSSPKLKSGISLSNMRRERISSKVQLEAGNKGPLHTRTQVESSNLQNRSLILGFDNHSSKAQTSESSTNLQALNSLRIVKWPCSKWDIQGGMILNKEALTTHGMLESPLAWVHPHKMRARSLNIPKLPLWGSLGFWPKACHNCSTWDPSKCHLSFVRPVKSSSSQVAASSVNWILNEQACVRGSYPPMRRFLSLQALNLSFCVKGGQK